MSAVIIGVDPGGAATGIVMRRGQHLDQRRTVERPGGLPRGAALVDDYYLAAIAAELLDLYEADHVDGLAVEGLNTPSPHLGMTNPGSIIAAGIVLGYVISWCVGRLDYVVVAPAGNGASPFPQAYPAELLDRGGRVAPKGQRRHERSAWDVAGAGALLLRTRPTQKNLPERESHSGTSITESRTSVRGAR